MTGFGDATGQVDGVHLAMELRSLNNRYYKATLRLPEELAALEAELDSALRKRVSRGSVTLIVNMRITSADAAYEVNTDALERYKQQVAGLDATVEAGSLLSLPGVLQPPQGGSLVDKVRAEITKMLDAACNKLGTMRQTEGQGLANDLLQHKAYIAERIAKVQVKAPVVVTEYQQRLRQRIEKMLAEAKLDVDQIDLIKEVAIYAERCDISEETQRIAAHLTQFEQLVTRNTNEPTGRTLDFLAQELLREANTIASKSNDAEIAQVIVEVKGAIDRIKEQVQNVE